MSSGRVTIQCQRESDVRVVLADKRSPYEDETVFRFEATAADLTARVDSIRVWMWDREYLPTFLDRLATDFRGWQGEREWRTNGLAVGAAFHSGGHVNLTWTLRPELIDERWQVSVTTWREAGEGMKALACDVRAFFDLG